MIDKSSANKKESNVLHILHELAKLENVTPIEWLGMLIMREARQKGLIKTTEQSRPTESKQKPAVRLENGSYDEFVTEG
jgi:hypothetical protein